MFSDKKNNRLVDLIDINFLQELQDDFANAMGIASITVDYNGPITNPSNFTEFCLKHVRSSNLGLDRCNKGYMDNGELAVVKGEPLIYTCHAGLINFIIPIIVDGEHIASILGSQFLTKPPNIKQFQKVAKELDAKDQEDYIKDLKKIKIIPEENVKAAVKLLSLIANSISEIAHKNKREKIYRHIIEMMRSSLDIEVVKHEMVFQIGKHFGADRVAFADYDSTKGNYFISTENEYRSSSEVKTFIGYDFAATPGFIEAIRELHLTGKDIIFSDLDKYLEDNNLKSTAIERFYNEMGFQSSMAINISHGDEFYGNLVITYEKKRYIKEGDIEFIRMLANQAGIALYQAELYKKEKQTAQRETILRDITDKIRSSLDIRQIQHEIVNQIGKYFNADGVRIADYDYKLGDYIVSPESEYKSSNKMESMIGLIFRNIPGFTEYIRDVHFSGEDIIFSDLDRHLNEKNLRNTGVEKFYRDYDFISSAAINIYYNDMYLGDFVITFKEKREFSEDEINFLKALANQAGTAFYQARLYQKEKQATEKEITLRETIKILRSTLDSEEIKKRFVEVTCNYFNADRCFFVDYDKKTDKFLPFRIEKRKSSDIKSLKGIDVEEFFPEFLERLKKGKNIIISDVKKILSKKQLVGYKSLDTLSKGDTNSDYGLLVKYEEQIMGILVIHFVEEKRALTHDEWDFLKVLSDQAGIALFHAELYLMTRQKVEEETLLNSITETIRSSLNIDETKKRIINIIGKTLNADRCLILEYNKANDKFLIINEEYLSSSNIPSYKGVDVNKNIPNLVREFKKGRQLIINTNRFQLDDEKLNINSGQFEEERDAIEKYKVHSALAFPIFHNDEFLGDLILHYVEGKHDVGDEEINFLNLIANQIAIAFQQAKLYEKIQLQAEREKISRNIIEILRSTMDKTTIKHLFVRNIGKYFNADRVFFSEFDNKESKYIPVDAQSEYLSLPAEKSFVDYDLSGEVMGGHIQPLKDKRELIIPCWHEYIKNNPKSPELISLYEEYNVQSSYSFPVLYEGRIMGYFCIEYTHKINELLDEDINRIRSICTQAGIAIYHAELYMQAQEALQSKGELIERVKTGIKEPVDNIMETSKILSEQTFEHKKQQEYLNNIINSCNKLMELTKDISQE